MDIDTFYLACLHFQYFLLAFHADFSRSSQEPVARSCLLYTAHPTVSKQVSSVVIPTTPKLIGFDVTYFLLTIPHRRFTCVHLLATYLAVFKDTTFNHCSLPISFHQKQHEVVCNQSLHSECGGPTTISCEVTANCSL